jgi:hypothetical protein
MFEPAGRVFGFAVKRTLEWSKIIFSERKGIRATDRRMLKRRDEGLLRHEKRFLSCEERVFPRRQARGWGQGKCQMTNN